MDFIKKNRMWITLGALGLALIACFLPFAKVSVFGISQSINYIDGGRDGILVLIAVIVSGVLVFLKKKFSTIPSGIAALITIYDILNVAKLAGKTSYAGVSISIGAILVLIGLIVAIIMPFIPENK